MKENLIVFFLFWSMGCLAQGKPEALFEDGSRVCFVGNSITNNGEFHHTIFLYHITRFPRQQTAFFNCGISGDIAGGVLKRMEDDILVHQPTHVVIMLGMNDVNRSLYGSSSTTNKDTLQRRKAAINSYKANLEKIVDIFLSKNIRVILQKPSIYDQTSKISSPNNLGVNDALKICADFIGQVAKKHKLATVDYWTVMTQLNEEMQKKDPLFTITGSDRVHPASAGHLVMAYQFLISGKAPRYVSKIIIGKNKRQSEKKSLNCQVNSLSRSSSTVRFSVEEKALPFPGGKNQQTEPRLVPFTEKLNVELLQITDLRSGEYALNIDGELIGYFSEKQLRKGLNLAVYENTPQYRQATRVRDKLNELWQLETGLRNIKFIEHNPLYKTFPDKENLEILRNCLDSLFTLKYHNNYYNVQLNRYIVNKPREKQSEEASERLRQEAYKIAQSTEHQFVIKKVKTTIEEKISNY